MIASLYDKFKEWSKNGSIWIISDTHFNDDDCKLMNENWISPEEHINIINKKVYKNDTLICLGDCGEVELFDKLKCQNKILIMGNHDQAKTKYLKYFNEVYNGPLFISDKILLSHEPIFGLKFCLNIHGHCHNGEYEYIDEFGGKHLNLASDVVNWEVTNLGELIKKGALSDIDNIHRITIENAKLDPIHKK